MISHVKSTLLIAVMGRHSGAGIASWTVEAGYHTGDGSKYLAWNRRPTAVLAIVD